MFSNFSAIIDNFDCDNQLNVGPRWDDWITRLNEYFEAAAIDNEKQMLASLFFLGGTKLRKIHSTLPEEIPRQVVQTKNLDTEYLKAVYRLTQFFNPKRNAIIETYNFRQSRQQSQETIEQFVTRLRLMAQYCEFDNMDKEIIGQVVQGCMSTSFRRKLLRTPGLKLEGLLDIGRVNDTVEAQAQVVEGKINETLPEDSVNFVHKKSFHKSFTQSNKDNSNKRYSQSDRKLGKHTNNHKYTNNRIGERRCFKCGLKFPHEGACPALGQRCRKCNGNNHFAAVCKANSSRQKTDNVNNVDTDIDNTKQNETDDDYVFSMHMENKLPTVNLNIQGIEAKFIIDTGASINVIDECIYRKLNPMPQLLRHDKPVYAFNSSSPLKVEGKFETQIQYKDSIEKAEMIVIKTRGRNLINYETSSKLGLIQMLDNIETKSGINNLENWRAKYPKVFSGQIGKLKDYQLILHIDQTIKPIQAVKRNHPFHLRQAIEKQIKLMLEQGIIEEVIGEPTSWLSETVNVKKRDSNEIRICVDMKAANQAISREQFEMPNVENLIYKANGMKKFNKLDLIAAFQQIELHPDSRHISSFRTHLGIFRFTRLFFGIKSAPEIFHHKITKILEGANATINATDDILIMGRDEIESAKNVEEVLRRLEANGLTVNPDKCKFDQEEVTFFGLKFNSTEFH